jgi:hypothetical protein
MTNGPAYLSNVCADKQNVSTVLNSSEGKSMEETKKEKESNTYFHLTPKPHFYYINSPRWIGPCLRQNKGESK